MKDISTKQDNQPGEEFGSISADDFNSPVEELENIVTGQGETLTGADNTQILTILKKIATPKTNDVIDPAIELWQAGNTSVTGISAGTYISDMIKYSQNGTMVLDSAKETSIVPVGANNSLKLNVTTAQSSIGATNFSLMQTYIEGYNIPKYVKNGYFTFAIWVRSNKTGTFSIAFRNSGIDRSYVVERTINAINTWELKECTIPMNFSGGTWNYTTGVGLYITISLAVGSSYQGTVDTWQAGNYFATSNQTNFVDQIGNTFYVGLLSCGAGRNIIDFDSYDYQTELKKESRYYGLLGLDNFSTRAYYLVSGAIRYMIPCNLRHMRLLNTPTLATNLGTDQKIMNGIGSTEIASYSGASLNLAALRNYIRIEFVQASHGLTDSRILLLNNVPIIIDDRF